MGWPIQYASEKTGDEIPAQFRANNSIIHSTHAFQSVDQVRYSKHSMAALQAALSWDLVHQLGLSDSPEECIFSRMQSIHSFWALPLNATAVPSV